MLKLQIILEQEVSPAHVRPEVHEEAPHRGDTPAGPRLQRERHHDGLQEHVHHKTLQNIQGCHSSDQIDRDSMLSSHSRTESMCTC